MKIPKLKIQWVYYFVFISGGKTLCTELLLVNKIKGMADIHALCDYMKTREKIDQCALTFYKFLRIKISLKTS